MGDMKLIGRLILVALLATLIGALFVPTARAAIDTLWLKSVGSLQTDSTDVAPTSVYFYWIDGVGTLDSVLGSPVNSDSLVWIAALAVASEGWTHEYAPVAWAQWNWDAGVDRDGDVAPVAWTVAWADSAGLVTGAVASVTGDVNVADADMGLIADSTYIVFTDGTNENQFKADVSALATSASTDGLLDSVGALLDTAYNMEAWIAQEASLFDPATDKVLLQDSTAARIDSLLTNLYRLMAYNSAVPTNTDSLILLYYPLDASSNKDSVQFLNAAGSRLGSWEFKHKYGTDSSVVDTVIVQGP